MKRLTVMILTIALTIPVFGREQQTLFQGEIDHGGYGGPVLKAVQIDGHQGLMVGGRGGWIVNHVFVLGAGGYGLATDHEMKPDSLLNLGYGGLFMNVILRSDDLFHLTAGSLFGAGGTGLRGEHPDWEQHGDAHNENPFWVIEPEVSFVLNVTNFFRVGAGVSYRYIHEMEDYNMNELDLNGFAANLEFKFGAF